jgi:hypothetical protein
MTITTKQRLQTAIQNGDKRNGLRHPRACKAEEWETCPECDDPNLDLVYADQGPQRGEEIPGVCYIPMYCDGCGTSWLTVYEARWKVIVSMSAKKEMTL